MPGVQRQPHYAAHRAYSPSSSGRKGGEPLTDLAKTVSKGAAKALKGTGQVLSFTTNLGIGCASFLGGCAVAGGGMVLSGIKVVSDECSNYIKDHSKQSTQQTDKKTSTHKSEHRPPISSATPKETKETSKNTPAQNRQILVGIASRMQKMTVSSKTVPVVKYSSFDKQNAAKTQARDKVDLGENYSVKDQFGDIQTYTKSDNLFTDQRV